MTNQCANLSVILSASLNLLLDNEGSNVSMLQRMMRAGSSNEYRYQILFG